MNMTTKTFITKDSNGCEFKCIALYNFEKDFDYKTNKIIKVRDDIYTAFDGEIKAKTLKELKELVSKI